MNEINGNKLAAGLRLIAEAFDTEFGEPITEIETRKPEPKPEVLPETELSTTEPEQPAEVVEHPAAASAVASAAARFAPPADPPKTGEPKPMTKSQVAKKKEIIVPLLQKVAQLKGDETVVKLLVELGNGRFSGVPDHKLDELEDLARGLIDG